MLYYIILCNIYNLSYIIISLRRSIYNNEIVCTFDTQSLDFIEQFLLSLSHVSILNLSPDINRYVIPRYW